MMEDRVEEATASQPETGGTVDVRKEGGVARLSGVGDALALAERESRAMEVMPPSPAAPRSTTSCSAEIHGAETMLMEGNVRAADGGSGREEDGHEAMRKKKKKKGWLLSAVNPPPKRRGISAVRRFPSGCGSLLPPAAQLSKC
ncbi:hypothetical protein ZWY2020_017191 [Hordeum vulgare]|nr:hypothetical protein ZWY2020_017191 [Hordeum vulgare]